MKYGLTALSTMVVLGLGSAIGSGENKMANSGGTALATATAEQPGSQKKKLTTVNDITTPGGLNVWYVSAPEIPVVTLSVTFLHAGVKNDPKGKAGLSDYLSSVIDEGAGQYDAQGFKQLLLEKNIHFKVSSRDDHFNIMMQCTKDNIADLFEILRIVLFEPRFEDTALARVKQQMLVYLQQSLHSESSVAADSFKGHAFKGHPYGVRLQTQIDQIPLLSKDDLKQYMKDWFTQDHLQISCAGCITEEDLKKNLDTVLGKLPAKGVTNTVQNMDPLTPADIEVIPMDIPQSIIFFYQKGISRQHPDFYAAYVLTKILGEGQFKSRLWDEIRESRGLAYYIDADLLWSVHSNYILGTTATTNANVKQVIELIREEWKKIFDKGITQQELDFTKDRLIGAYPLGFASTKHIVAIMDIYHQDGLPSDFISKRNDEIRKVTLADVNRVAKSLIKSEDLTFIIVGKPIGVGPGETFKPSDIKKREPSETVTTRVA